MTEWLRCEVCPLPRDLWDWRRIGWAAGGGLAEGEPNNETKEEGDYSRSHHTLPNRVLTNTVSLKTLSVCFTVEESHIYEMLYRV